jgi:enamine deaminase RidA (YjgF/YER057c/UK114 family)
MTISRIDIGPRMSQAVTHGDTVYLAGVVAHDAPGASIADQTRSILARIDDLLAQGGTDKSKLLTATIWITDMRYFAEMNEVWDAWIDPANPPCRACVEANLAATHFNVEIMVVAAR